MFTVNLASTCLLSHIIVAEIQYSRAFLLDFSGLGGAKHVSCSARFFFLFFMFSLLLFFFYIIFYLLIYAYAFYFLVAFYRNGFPRFVTEICRQAQIFTLNFKAGDDSSVHLHLYTYNMCMYSLTYSYSSFL